MAYGCNLFDVIFAQMVFGTAVDFMDERSASHFKAGTATI